MIKISDIFIDKTPQLLHAADWREVFHDVSLRVGFGHITYFGVFPIWGGQSRCELITTYPRAWERHYFERGFEKIDPILTSVMRGVLPLEWEQISCEDREIRNFFGEASDFGIEKRGASIPVRGPFGDRSVLSVTASGSKTEWSSLKKYALPDLMYCASLIHNSVATTVYAQAAHSEQVLSNREVEVLEWSAKGKTAWETAQILGISDRTIDFHLRNAVHKLGAQNKTQAVSIAISRNFLTLPFQI